MLRISAHPKRHISTTSPPVLVGSFLALLLMFRFPRLRRKSQRSKWSMSDLRRALIGHPKQQVTEILGPPHAVYEGPSAVWYYPLNAGDRLAMAISFTHEHVRSVEFFDSPV